MCLGRGFPNQSRKQAERDEPQQEDPEDRHVVEGKNPVRSTNIKCLEVMRRIFHIEKNASNQKTGRHEEQIDAAPGEFLDGGQPDQGRRLEMDRE